MFEKITVSSGTRRWLFDIFSQGTLRGYVGMSQKGGTEQARKGSHIVIGPWGHGASREFGDIDFGSTANVEALDLQVRWYDYWLQGIDNGLAKEPPVKLFVMGRNEWVFEQEYPLARTDYRSFYFPSDGRANSDKGTGALSWKKPAAKSAPDRCAYDPAKPVPSLGGNNCCGTPTPTGPKDQRPIEGRQDILVYNSDALQEEPRSRSGQVVSTPRRMPWIPISCQAG